MAVGYARPDVTDMVLRVFERSVHPELFDAVRECHLNVGRNKAILKLSSHGHLFEFRTRRSVLTEVATSRHSPLPLNMRMVDRRLIGYRTHMIDSIGIRYHCSYQLEAVPLDIYLQLHREMEFDCRTATLATMLPGSSPTSPDCISMLKCDILPEGLVIHAYHTFPDNAAVLRTQTLFEVI